MQTAKILADAGVIVIVASALPSTDAAALLPEGHLLEVDDIRSPEEAAERVVEQVLKRL